MESNEYQKKLELYQALLLKKKLRGLEDLYFFNKYILETDPERRRLIVPHVHGEWAEWFSKTKSRVAMILVPRGSFKTTFFTVGWTLQQIAKNRDVRILIANATLANSQRILSEIKDHLTKNELFKELYGEFYDPKLKWNEDEITVSQRSLGIKEATVTAAGAGGNLVSTHFDTIIADDLVNSDNSATRYQAEKVIDWWRKSLSLLEPQGKMLIIGCLTADSKVLMADGSWKEIVKVKPGEYVYSYKEKKLVKQKVLAMIPQGEDDVFEIKTIRHSIKANARHPFLVVEKGKAVWKRVRDLKIGDKVVTIARASYDTSKRHPDGRFLRSDFFYFLGYMFGDGWLIRSKKRGNVGYAFAKSIYPKKDKVILNAIEKWLGRKAKETKYGYYRVDDKAGAMWLEKIGFRGNAKTKRVPEWMFTMRACYKKAFIDGLLAADGSRTNRGAYRLELANRRLIEDIYWLALTCGYRPGPVLNRTRTIKAPNSPKEVVSKFYSISLVYNTRQAFGLNQYNWRLDRIQSIDKLSKEEVYDLSVEGSENFIANGYVVHNTRWTYYELYSHILDEHPEIDTYIRGVYNPDGSLYFPERYDEKKLQELKNYHGSFLYSSFYLNQPFDIDTAVIKKSQIKYYKKLPDNVNYFVFCDPAISQESYSDYTALVVVAVDSNENWYVVDLIRGKLTVSEMIDKLFFTYAKYKPKTMGIEVIGLAQTLMSSINDEETRRGIYLPLTEVKSQAGTKAIRIRSVLQPRFERGSVFLKKNLVELEDELLTFPSSKHDDAIDALASIEQIAYPPDRGEIEDEDKPEDNMARKIWEKLRSRNNPVDPVLGEYY